MNSINISFPIKDDNSKNTYFALNNVSKNALTSNLLLLLLTDKGERYYNPDYGTNIKKYLFEPNDEITLGEIETDIKETVKKFIPELTITNIEFHREGMDEAGNIISDNEIKILVEFLFEESVFQDTGTLELSFNV